MNVNLISISPKGGEKSFPLSAAVTTLGRQEDCTLKIPLSEISRQHCQIIIKDDTVFAKDLGSGNGTFLNGKKFTGEITLKAGDIISLAEAVKFLVQIDGKPVNYDESKLKSGSVAGAAPPPQRKAKAEPAKPAKPVKPAASPAAKTSPGDETDDILSESFFKDLDEDEDS